MGCGPAPRRLAPGESPVVVHRRPKPSLGAQLLAQGYERRTTAAPPRLTEIVEEYRRIGFEVELVAHEAEPDACNTCFEDPVIAQAGYQDVYVRAVRRGEGGR